MVTVYGKNVGLSRHKISPKPALLFLQDSLAVLVRHSQRKCLQCNPKQFQQVSIIYIFEPGVPTASNRLAVGTH